MHEDITKLDFNFRLNCEKGGGIITYEKLVYLI